jgi:hypothetical protein
MSTELLEVLGQAFVGLLAVSLIIATLRELRR